MSLVNKLRKGLWRILGVDYNHILKIIDYVYLKEDRHTTIGFKSYSNNALVFRWSDAPLKIGKYCSIADGVRFIMDQGKHLTNCVSSYPFKTNEIGKRSGITIGNDVWIGQKSIIMPGVKIGNGVTIAAGAVVTDDIPDYCVAAGIPAKIIKRKCSEKEASLMNLIAWWDWPEEKITSAHDDFNGSIADFITKYRQQVNLC